MARSARRGGARPTRWAWLVVAAAVALAIATPVAVLGAGDGSGKSSGTGETGGRVPDAIEPAAPRPGESCPDETPAPGSSDVCSDVNDPDVPGIGGLDLGILLPILGALLAGAAIALLVVFVILRRRPVGPLEPADPGEWWTCANCGKTNVIGSARCYACGTWNR